MGRHRIQRQTHQITTPNHKENRHHTPTGSKLVKTSANHHQQNLIGQQHRPFRNNKDTHEIQDTIRNKSHYQERGDENTDKTGVLPNTTKSTTITVPSTRGRKKRNRPINKFRTFTKIRNNRRRLFRIPRCNYGKKGQKVKIALVARKLNEKKDRTCQIWTNY